MKSLAILLLLLPFLCTAHPGVGIVADSKGNIFYTDLHRVWKIYPDGHKQVVVPNVHTHELSIDKDDNLYGQHSVYSGEATNTYSYYVWRLSPAGMLDTIIPETSGFFIEDYSFVRDAENNLYWISHGQQDRIMKKLAQGGSVELVRGNFKHVQWLHVHNGKLYFIQNSSIYVLDSLNRIRTFAQNLTGGAEAHNTLFGLWSDAQGHLYTGNLAQRKIQQIDARGAVRDYYFSEEGWMPSAGVFDKNGILWVMEYSPQNAVRVTKAKQVGPAPQPEANKTFNAWLLLLLLPALRLLLLNRRK